MHFFNRHIVAVSIDTGIFSIIHFRMADSKRRRLAYTRKWKSVHRNLKKVSSINRPIYSDSDDSTDDTYESPISEENSPGPFPPSPSVHARCSSDRGQTSYSASDTSSDNDDYIWNRINEMNDEDLFSSEEECDVEDQNSLKDDLAAWANKHSIKHNHIDDLLKIMQNHGHVELPSTARTLLKTPTIIEVQVKSQMEYVYFPIEGQLLKYLRIYPDECIRTLDSISLSLNIDGLPVFKSSQNTFWPVLCAIHLKPITVFPVALTFGQSKPSNLDFLTDTVNDLNILLRNGLQVDGRHIQVNFKCVVCDAPARAMVKRIKQYSGYYGCDRCDQKGVWLNKMTFQQTANLSLRTDVSFRQQLQEEHHHGVSILCDLPINMIKTFPLDYMHMCCLGVMKRLLLVWLRGKKQTRLSSGQISSISTRLKSLRKSIPNCFARKPRDLAEVDRWKATEFRQFLLYTGRIVLNGILRKDLYDHFMTLCVSVGILLSPKLVQNREYVNYSHGLLTYFVEEGHNLYSPSFMVYNVHGLVHLADDAKEFLSLDNCSAFPFENYLHQIKRHVRNGNNPLLQLVKRLTEKDNYLPNTKSDGIQIKLSRPDNAYILNDENCCEAVSVSDTKDNEGNTNILCRVYQHMEAHSNNPIDSKLIGVYKGSFRYTRMKVLSPRDLHKRAIMIDEGNGGDRGTVTFIAILHAF